MPDGGSYTRTLIYPRDIFGRRTEIFDDWPSQNWYGADQYWARVAGQRLLMGGSTSYLRHADVVGSSTMLTDQTGAPVEEMLYYPFGGEWENNGTSWDEKFARLQTHDADLGTDMTNNRLYMSIYGRWMTPDPMGGDVTNPQSLNRYAYVTNNPASLTDPLGLGSPDPCSDPVYAMSDAQCQGGCGFLNPEECPPACSSLNPESSIYCDCIEYGYCGYLYGASYGDYGGGGGAIPPPAGQPPLAGGPEEGGYVSGVTVENGAYTIFVDVAEGLEKVTVTAGYGLGILAGLISNPTVANAPEATWQPPKAVPVSNSQATHQSIGRHFEVCHNVPGAEFYDPERPGDKVCVYRCPTYGEQFSYQPSRSPCPPRIMFGP